MEEHIDALNSLFEHGSCAYFTTYMNYPVTVSIRTVAKREEFYNYVFSVHGIRQAIFDMLEQSIISKQERIHFTACMSEELSPIEVPVMQVPVHQLSTLEIVITILSEDDKGISHYPITTTFNDFNY